MLGYKFGPWAIDASEVFYATALSFAFVNLKPVVPGHVLVSPKRVVPRFTDLTKAELADMYQVVQRIGPVIERHHKATALTITTQDGAAAGQTVPHVHVHVLPRKAGDFEKNDEVYDAVDDKSVEFSAAKSGGKLDLDAPRVQRTAEDMAAEATELRRYFSTSE